MYKKAHTPKESVYDPEIPQFWHDVHPYFEERVEPEIHPRKLAPATEHAPAAPTPTDPVTHSLHALVYNRHNKCQILKNTHPDFGKTIKGTKNKMWGCTCSHPYGRTKHIAKSVVQGPKENESRFAWYLNFDDSGEPIIIDGCDGFDGQNPKCMNPKPDDYKQEYYSLTRTPDASCFRGFFVTAVQEIEFWFLCW